MKNKLNIVLLACIMLVPPAQCAEQPTKDPAIEQAAEHIQQGNVYYDQGQFDQAISKYTIAIELDPYLAEAYWSRGRAYYFNLQA